MSGSGQEALPNVREWSEGPLGCPGVVGAHSDVRERSGGPTGCQGVFRRPSWMSGS